MFGPVIKGEKIDLVPPRKEDMAICVKWFEDREVTRFLGLLMPPSLEDENEWYDAKRKSKEDVIWFIALKSGERIGSTGLHSINSIDRRAISGIVIGDRSHWGKGIATEVMCLRTNFAFESLNLNSVETKIAVSNRGSWRAAEKAGYCFAGILRQYFYRDGNWYDVKIGQILKEDWEKTKQG